MINLEKQFVKGLQNLGEPLIFKLVGKLQNLQYMKLIEWPIFSNLLLSDLTSQGNPVTRGLSVRYNTILLIRSLFTDISTNANITTNITINITTNIITNITTNITIMFTSRDTLHALHARRASMAANSSRRKKSVAFGARPKKTSPQS